MFFGLYSLVCSLFSFCLFEKQPTHFGKMSSSATSSQVWWCFCLLRGGGHRMQIATMQVAGGAEVQECQNVKCAEKKV